MKYRIKNFSYKTRPLRHGGFKAIRKNLFLPCILPPARRYDSSYKEHIDLRLLFEISTLPAPKPTPLYKKILSATRSVITAITTALAAVAIILFSALELLVRPFIQDPRKNERLAFFSGAFCASSMVALLTAATVLLGLFGGYFAPSQEIIIPDVVGMDYQQTEDSLSENIELLVSYRANDKVPAGVIITQMPNADTVRKIKKNGSPCSLSVTVSTGKSFYSVEDISGMDSRSALLGLQNNGVTVKRVYEYSSTVPKGTVISTSPKAQSKLYSDQTLTVKISLGESISTVKVPDLYGLSEAQAVSILSAGGLSVGKITYKQSSATAGKVIEQQYSPYTSVTKGSSIDISISIGMSSVQKTVPDLYGLTVSEAKKRLAEVGLVIGGIYSVSSGAPTGTIIMQSPAPSTIITSSITSVDVYISY